MGIFHSKHVDLTQVISDLKEQEAVLKVREKEQPHVYNFLISFIMSLAIAITIFFKLQVNVYDVTCWVLVLLMIIIKKVRVSSTQKQLKRIKDKQEENARKLRESVVDNEKFIKGINEENQKSQKDIQEFGSISPLCTLWDRISGSYKYNPDALICPNCKINNGMYDINKSSAERFYYICPNCNCRVNREKVL